MRIPSSESDMNEMLPDVTVYACDERVKAFEEESEIHADRISLSRLTCA